MNGLILAPVMMPVMMMVMMPAVAAAGPLWGEHREAPGVRYEKLCAQAREVLRSPQGSGPEALRGMVSLLREATRLDPDGAEGWALLGRALVEIGQTAEALPVLRRAEELGAGDTRLLLSLALVSAQAGDLDGALELYQRLHQRGLASSLLHRRTGDVLMALGRLEEAIVSYQRACAGTGAAPVELARGCYALAAALDREERLAAAAAVLRRAVQLDVTQRSLREGDFVPPADRLYILALLAWHRRDACAEQQALRRYLGQGPGYPARAMDCLDRLDHQAGVCSEEKEEYGPGTRAQSTETKTD